MRKDVRTGAVIGGILIAVMIVYAIVASRGHADKKKDSITLDSGKTSTAGDSTGGADRSTADAGGTSHDDRNDPPAGLTHDPLPGVAAPTAGPSHGDDAPAPASADGRSTTNWAALLSADHVEPVRTHTPAPAGVEPPAVATPPGHLNSGGPPTELPLSDPPARTTDRATDSHVRSAAPATGGTTHRVAEGETFSSIARTVYGNSKFYKEIIKANPKVDPTHLRPGMVITLPDKSQLAREAAPTAPATAGGRTEIRSHSVVAVASINPATEYRVQANDNLYKISTKLYHSANKMDAIYQLNKTVIGADPAKLKLNMVLRLPEPPTQTASR